MSASSAVQTSDLLQHAVDFHQRGMLTAALAAYQDILRLQPRHFDALHLSGVIAAQLNDPQRAIALMSSALSLDGDNVRCLCNRALVLQQIHAWDDALADYNRVLILEPNWAEAYFNRGVLLHALKRRECALTDYERALALDPGLAVAHANRGIVLEQVGRRDAALASLRRALELQPTTEFYLGYASMLHRFDCSTEALATYEHALAIDPHSSQAHSERSVVLLALHRDAAAVESAQRAVTLDATNALAHINLGNALKQLGNWSGALASYDGAIALDGNCALAHTNRGNVLKDMNRLEEALSSHDRAIALAPDLADAHFNRSFVLLLLGDYVRGFAEYEWRWRVAHGVSPRDRRDFHAPLWLGDASLAGKTILLHSEQGLGDTIQFCRYVALVARLGAHVILQVPQPLARLVRRLDGAMQCLVDEEDVPEYDYHCPLLSLPLAFATSSVTVPAPVPYLSADAVLVAEWRSRLGPRTRPRVGLVWSGGLGPNPLDIQSAARRRNIPLGLFDGFDEIDVEFYSLQKGEHATSELARMPCAPNMIDFTAHLTDFAQTAALIELLDLVISVDTSTAHLAGALGSRVWILNRFDSCWRWLHGRSDSPWYPTARVYSQIAPNDWTEPLCLMRSDLAVFAKSMQPA